VIGNTCDAFFIVIYVILLKKFRTWLIVSANRNHGSV
jgi:hypothetical protein